MTLLERVENLKPLILAYASASVERALKGHQPPAAWGEVEDRFLLATRQLHQAVKELEEAARATQDAPQG